MKIQQLKFLLAIANNELNISTAADKLFTSQPGVSKQLKLLEDELGLRLFTRNGKNLVSTTPAGQEVIRRARTIIQEVDNIKNLSSELRNEASGSLSIATTHTQARYVLPDVLSVFHQKYPDVTVDLHQGTTEQIAHLLSNGDADFAIATGSYEFFHNTVHLPCYQWERVILLPKDHPLVDKNELTLEDLAQYALVTYVFSLTGSSTFLKAFEDAGLKAKIAFTARDADVIKAYVRKGLGVGIIADLAYSPDEDHDLVMRPADQLFPSCTTWLGFNKDEYLNTYMMDFINLFAIQWSESKIKKEISDAHKKSSEKQSTHQGG